MISKELFIECMNNIKKQDEKMKKFNDIIEELSDCYCTFDCNNLYYESLMKLLYNGLGLDDNNDIIYWWLYETDVKKIIYNEDDTVCKDVSKLEDLYDYIVENKNSTNN